MNKLLNWFKPKRERTLADFDNLTISDIDNLLQSRLPNIEAINQEVVSKTCKDCGGELIIVSPQIIMSNMILHECINCHNRCYKEN